MAVNKSKYYYDYTRNMKDDEALNVCCGKPLCTCCDSEGICLKENCECHAPNENDASFFEAWTKSLEESEQPKCDITNQEDCENCGS
jgi:hypothetical protein